MAVNMRRSVIAYHDLDAPPAATPAAGARSAQQQVEDELTNGHASTSSNTLDEEQGNRHWSAQGVPLSASAQRKYRALLNLLAKDNIDDARRMLTALPLALKNEAVLAALAEAHDRQQRLEDGVTLADGSPYQGNGGMPNGMMPRHSNGSAAGQYAAHERDNSIASNGTDRQLSHAEIWDDSALVDAWDAAMQEYQQFDKMRSQAAADTAAKSAFKNGDKGTPGKSALWNDAPAVGSSSASEARRAAELSRAKEDAVREVAAQEAKALVARKAQARRLLEEVAGPSESQMNGHAAPAAKRRKVTRGIVPPSSSVQGNTAWHLACATVSQTPNRIGSDTADKDKKLSTNDDANHQQSAEPAATTSQSNATQPSSGSSDEVLQNLAMSWYYAGYYQAMASSIIGGSSGGASS